MAGEFQVGDDLSDVHRGDRFDGLVLDDDGFADHHVDPVTGIDSESIATDRKPDFAADADPAPFQFMAHPCLVS